VECPNNRGETSQYLRSLCTPNLVRPMVLSSFFFFFFSLTRLTEYSVPVCTIPGLISLNPYFHSTPLDQPWHALAPAIWFQVVQSLSIVCACIPGLKRVLADLQTGMMGGTVSEFFELTVSGGRTNTLYGSGTKSASKSGYGVGSGLHSANDPAAREDDGPGSFAGGKQNKGAIRGQEGKPTMAYRTVVERSDSLKNLTDNAIVQTIDYEVTYERSQERPRASSSSHDVGSYHSDGWSSTERPR
jgi:hypothetical protein